MEVLLDTPAASAWLARHGVRRTAATLRKLRCHGTGPRFRRLNSKPFYVESDLIRWVEERLTAPVGSTSEADAEKPSAGIGDPGINDFFDDVPAQKRGSPHLTDRRAASPGRASPPAVAAPNTKPSKRRSSREETSTTM